MCAAQALKGSEGTVVPDITSPPKQQVGGSLLQLEGEGSKVCNETGFARKSMACPHCGLAVEHEGASRGTSLLCRCFSKHRTSRTTVCCNVLIRFSPSSLVEWYVDYMIWANVAPHAQSLFPAKIASRKR